MSGSSPHTWGIPDGNPQMKIYARFIPTYVGHTGASNQQKPTPTVHPHIRGAYYFLRRALTRDRRFIPTYVGHTLDRRKKNGWFQPLFL